jgi:subtilisin-like proprotein convertase family protein
VAPQASLAALRLTALAATDAQEASAFGFQPHVIHILNNSWNPTDNGTTLKAPGPLAAAARQSAALTGRNGRGRIFVWSSGNGRLAGDDCNFDGYANSRFAIAVGAATDAAVQMPTSEGCSALMVVAPAGGGSRTLTTTDLIGTPGYDGGDYTSAFGGASTGAMSAAAPTVSGAVALMLARNPNLTWRDVQHILRRSSVRILPTDAGWTSGAFPHNERLGFGLLDADAAVDLAGTWSNVPSEEVLSPGTRNVNRAIPDINATGISDTITISGVESNFVIEHIEVDFNATHTWRGDLQVKLTSPSGVVSNLAPIRPSDSGDNFTNWKFGSVRHWGQTAAGVWTLNVADRRFQDTGTWNNWTLRIYGYHSSSSAPGTFGKSSPAGGATGVPTSTTLSWTASSGATSYEYCRAGNCPPAMRSAPIHRRCGARYQIIRSASVCR